MTLGEQWGCVECGAPCEMRMVWCSDACKKAHGERREREVLEEERREAERKRRERARFLERGSAAALNRLSAWASTDEDQLFAERVKAPKLRRFADGYELGHGNGVLLGTTGVGKTSATMRAVRRLIRRAAETGEATEIFRVHVVTGGVLAGARRRHPLGEGDAPELRAAAEASVLLLDDLGVGADPEPSWLHELLDERYTHSAVTIATSGFRREELVQRYGAGAIRRLQEPRGVCVEVWSGGGGVR